MRVLVTGAAGGVGTYILKRLAGKHEIVGFDAVEGARLPGVQWVVGDILDTEWLAKAAQGCDGMIHLAGIPIYHPDRVLDIGRINIYGMQSAIEAAVRAGVKRFVYASSICATAFINWHTRRVPKYFPVDEEYFDLPDDIYGLSKYVNEKIAEIYELRHGIETTGLRMATVWLPDHDFTNQWLGEVLREENDNDLHYLDLRWQYVDVRDAAQAFDLALNHPTGLGVCNVGAADTPGGDWRIWIKSLYPDVPVLRHPAAYIDDPGKPLWSIQKLADAAGYRPQHTWREYPVFVEEWEAFLQRTGLA